MREPDGYTLGKLLHSTPRSEVWAAVRARDGREVVLKCYSDDRHADERARAHRELEALRQAAGPGVVPAIDWITDTVPPILVMDRVPGVTLTSWSGTTPSIEACIEIGLQLAEALGHVHAARLIHRDVQPQNVLVDPETRRTHLIDFGLARPIGAVQRRGEAREPGGGRAGSLRYISPEQTGRMDRGVDARSDLYSLGATLYLALTGRPPFDSGDPLAIIHGHITRVPTAPSELRAMPAALSRLVMKLLQKAPEDRYQTARSVSVDLARCRELLSATGGIPDDLPLGVTDAPKRPLFTQKLYGRSAEVSALVESYAHASSGTPTVLLLRGAAGIGKSSLVQSLHSALADTGGHLACARFDVTQRTVPYWGFTQIFGALARQLLTESEARLANWRFELNQSLGSLGSVLIGLVPELALVLGEVPRAPERNAAQTRARLELAVERFITAAATREHPLVLSLDDLQWTDDDSIEMLASILQRQTRAALLILCAYRDAEIAPGSPLTRLIESLPVHGVATLSLTVGPLGESECTQMLAEALGQSQEDTLPLARCVASKTGGSPLLIQQFVQHLYDLRLIRFETPGGWTWEPQALEATELQEDAVGLLTLKLSRLQPAMSSVIQLASCVGSRFDLDTLIDLSHLERAALETALFELCDEGLIAPAETGFAFVHNRVREAAQASLGLSDRTRLHADVARRLLRITPDERLHERVFQIAEHLHLALAQLSEPEKQRAIEIHLLAGKRALAAGAGANASRYLTTARQLFGQSLWQSRFRLGFELHLLSAESALQLNDFDAALALLDSLDQHELRPVQAAQVAARRISVLSVKQLDDGMLPLLHETFARFGLKWAQSPGRLHTRLAMWRADRALRGPLDERAFKPLPPNVKGDWVPQLIVVGASLGSLAAVRSPALLLALSFLICTFRKHGYVGSMAGLLAGYASARSPLVHDLRDIERYAKAAEEWCQRRRDLISPARAQYTLNAWVYPRLRPRRCAIVPLQRAAQQLIEAGDPQFAIYALWVRSAYMALEGEPLEELERVYLEIGERSRGGSARLHEVHLQALKLLRQDSGDSSALDREITAVHDGFRAYRSSRLMSWAVWIMVVGILGRFEKLLEIAEEISSLSSAPSQQADIAMFRGVAAAVIAGETRGIERARMRRLLRRCIRTLADSRTTGPGQEYMKQTLAAEHARLRGHTRDALALYTQAVQRALDQGKRHHAAFLHERRADLLRKLERRSEAASAMGQAAAFYKAWGARAKSAALARDRRPLVSGSTSETPHKNAHEE